MFPGNGQHKSVEKYLRAVEKVLCVHSTMSESVAKPQIPEARENKSCPSTPQEDIPVQQEQPSASS
jgi:hypothetical protein